MKKSLIVAAFAAVAGLAGCKSIEVERHGQTLATYTDTNGVVHAVCDMAGKPVILDGGWEVEYFQHWNWQKFDGLSAKAGKDVSLDINNYEGGASASNLTALVASSFEGGAKLATAIGDAYVKIAGGGAQAATAMDVASKVYSSFTDGGGDASKAQVKADTATNTVTVSDGNVCTTCTADGTCTTGACSDTK